MNHLNFKILNILIAFLIFLLIIGCTETSKKVRIAYNQYTGDLPFYVAKENGYFDKYGVEVEFVEAGNSSEALNALLAGKVDIISPISFSAMIAAETKSPGEFKLFLPGGENDTIIGSYLLVKKSSNYLNLEQLKDKKIGTYTGATQLLYLKLFLSQAGYIPEKDFNIIQVDYSLQSQALESGQLDALFTIEPIATIALQNGIAKVLIENPRVKYIVNPFISGSAAVSIRFLKEYPNEIKKIYRAVAEGLDFIRNNQADARKILPKYTPLDSNLANKTNLLVWYKVDEQIPFQAIQKISDLLYANKIIKQKVDMSKLFLKKNDLL